MIEDVAVINKIASDCPPEIHPDLGTGVPLTSSTRKWIWWMWKSCTSNVRFSIVQSSTDPLVVTIAGGSSGLYTLASCPSTTMKNFAASAGGLCLWPGNDVSQK